MPRGWLAFPQGPRLQVDPNSAAHRELKTELEELVQLSRDLITEYHNTHAAAAAPKQKTLAIAQMAAKQSANQVTELGGWKTGDKCRTVAWLGPWATC